MDLSKFPIVSTRTPRHVDFVDMSIITCRFIFDMSTYILIRAAI
jgi:hypothetical protein